MTFSNPLNATLASPVFALALATPGASAQNLSEKPIGSVIVTATRTPQPSNEVLSDTVVIEAAEIARNDGAGSAASVFIRGANANQNVVLVDGVRIGLRYGIK